MEMAGSPSPLPELIKGTGAASVRNAVRPHLLGPDGDVGERAAGEVKGRPVVRNVGRPLHVHIVRRETAKVPEHGVEACAVGQEESPAHGSLLAEVDRPLVGGERKPAGCDPGVELGDEHRRFEWLGLVTRPHGDDRVIAVRPVDIAARKGRVTSIPPDRSLGLCVAGVVRHRALLGNRAIEHGVSAHWFAGFRGLGITGLDPLRQIVEGCSDNPAASAAEELQTPTRQVQKTIHRARRPEGRSRRERFRIHRRLRVAPRPTGESIGGAEGGSLGMRRAVEGVPGGIWNITTRFIKVSDSLRMGAERLVSQPFRSFIETRSSWEDLKKVSPVRLRLDGASQASMPQNAGHHGSFL